MTLFLNEFGSIETDEEFRALREKECKYDPDFLSACGWRRHDDFRKWVDSLYKNYSGYLDEKFPSQIKKHFNGGMWELYLTSVFVKEAKIELIKRDEEKGPDFKTRLEDGRTLWVEAIAGKVPSGELAISESGQNHFSGSIDEIDDPKILRITSCLKEKNEKLKEYMKSGIVKSNDLFIVAINGSDFDGIFDGESDNILSKAMYGLHHETYCYDTKMRSYLKRANVINKNNSPISVSPFFLKEYENISGVIYSKNNIWEFKDYKSELVLLHNLKSKKPLPDKLFEFINVV